MEIAGAVGVVEGVIEVGRAAVKGREQEAQFRCGDRPVRPAQVEGWLLGLVGQGGLGLLDRADAADDVGKLVLRGVVQAAAVLPAIGDVIDLVGQQDNIVGFQREGGGDGLVKSVQGLGILQGGIPQGRKKPVLVAVGHLLGAEGDVNEVAALGSGQNALEERQELSVSSSGASPTDWRKVEMISRLLPT